MFWARLDVRCSAILKRWTVTVGGSYLVPMYSVTRCFLWYGSSCYFLYFYYTVLFSKKLLFDHLFYFSVSTQQTSKRKEEDKGLHVYNLIYKISVYLYCSFFFKVYKYSSTLLKLVRLFHNPCLSLRVPNKISAKFNKTTHRSKYSKKHAYTQQTNHY